MGREVKRVPMDFNAPLDKVWHGFLINDEFEEKECPACSTVPEATRGWDCKTCGGNWVVYAMEDGTFWKETPPPTGPGFQMWETTTEGSPQSPVFATLDELVEWCAKHATTFGRTKASAAEWKRMLGNGLVGVEMTDASGRKVMFC